MKLTRRGFLGGAAAAALGGAGVYELVEYHLGWRDERGVEVPAPAGKMLRPLLCLTAAAGYGTADDALDAAASIELLHAFQQQGQGTRTA